MGRNLKALDFAGWIAYVFDHPAQNDVTLAWYFDHEADIWKSENQPIAAVYMARLFESPVDVLAPYTDAQINQGLNFLINNAASSHIFALINPHTPPDDVARCARAMFHVFEQILAPRCTPHLGHLSEEEGKNPLNSVCYMWWDIMPLIGAIQQPPRPNLDAIWLDVMRRTLDLESDACREGALHGLGHWHMYYAEKTETIIDAFLESHPDLRPELRAYALRARRGAVL